VQTCSDIDVFSLKIVEEEKEDGEKEDEESEDNQRGGRTSKESPWSRMIDQPEHQTRGVAHPKVVA
jgi:hypothetical protein